MIKQSDAEADQMHTVVEVIRETEEEIQSLFDDFKHRNKIAMDISQHNTVWHNTEDLDISGYENLMQSVSMSESAIPPPEADS